MFLHYIEIQTAFTGLGASVLTLTSVCVLGNGCKPWVKRVCSTTDVSLQLVTHPLRYTLGHSTALTEPKLGAPVKIARRDARLKGSCTTTGINAASF